LRGPVTSQELAVSDPAGDHHLRLQEWKDDMATTEHERAYSIEAVSQVKPSTGIASSKER
jgi:hypothetical protein